MESGKLLSMKCEVNSQVDREFEIDLINQLLQKPARRGGRLKDDRELMAAPNSRLVVLGCGGVGRCLLELLAKQKVREYNFFFFHLAKAL